MPADFSEAKFTTRVWSHTAREGTPFRAIADVPAYWAHVAGKLAAGDLIQVHAQDRSFYAELYVVAVRAKAAVVHALRHEELPEIDEAAAASPYRVEWGGPHHKWRVVRASDGSVVAHGFAVEAEASLHAIQTDKKIAV
jgi:hypothetical protein